MDVRSKGSDRYLVTAVLQSLEVALGEDGGYKGDPEELAIEVEAENVKVDGSTLTVAIFLSMD